MEVHQAMGNKRKSTEGLDESKGTPKKTKKDEAKQQPVVHTCKGVRYTQAQLDEIMDIFEFERLVEEPKKCNCKSQVHERFKAATFVNKEDVTLPVCAHTRTHARAPLINQRH